MYQIPTAYTIRTKKLNLRIAILEISTLHFHEATIPQLVAHLTTSIASDGYVKDPIIVDEKSLTVLDGVHRVAALKQLQIPRIPACLVDYSNPNIKVCNWYRTLANAPNLERTIKTLKIPRVNIGTHQESDPSNIGTAPNVATVELRNTSFLIRSKFNNISEAYDVIGRIESRLRSRRIRIRYETERDALQDLHAGTVDAVIRTPELTKKKIVDLALSGIVLSAKTTRHVIPARPLRVNVPLNLLRNRKKPLSEANDELRNVLLTKRLQILPSGAVFEGRRYEEELYVFEGSS